MTFDIATTQLADDACLVAVAGDLDLYTSPQLKQELLTVIADGARHVVVDLAETTFIDTTTLGVLVGAVKRLRPDGGELSLVCADRNITKIFGITGLDRVFPIHPTRAEALERLGVAVQPSA